MRTTPFLILGAAAALAGCATAPEAIAPAYTSTVPFETWSCRQLGEEEARLTAALGEAYTAQHKARSNDTAGVLLLGLPVSSLSGGNMAGEVARLKGQKEAVQKTEITKNCSVQPS